MASSGRKRLFFIVETLERVWSSKHAGSSSTGSFLNLSQRSYSSGTGLISNALRTKVKYRYISKKEITMAFSTNVLSMQESKNSIVTEIYRLFSTTPKRGELSHRMNENIMLF